MIDVSIFDFLLQNGDRHHYEVLFHKLIYLDNGKGLRDPNNDYLDILAPLYQCCWYFTFLVNYQRRIFCTTEPYQKKILQFSD